MPDASFITRWTLAQNGDVEYVPIPTPSPETEHSTTTIPQLALEYQFSPDLPDDPRERLADDYDYDENYLIADRLLNQLIHDGRLLECHLCGRWTNAQIHQTIRRGNRNYRACSSCRANTRECPQCGELVLQGADADCPACTSAYINPYNYQPATKPRLTDQDLKTPHSKRLLIGIEFEFEVAHKINFARAVDDAFAWATVKHDGSLTHGVEITTQPFTPLWFKENKDQFELLFSKAEKYGATALNTCGTHFHLSKKPFSNHHLYKFLKLIYENKDKILAISGRTDLDRVRRYASFDDETQRDLVKKATIKRNVATNRARGNDKYLAVNLQHQETVEVRFFAGCSNFNTFMKYYQATLAFYYFTRDSGRSEITWDNFRKWVTTNRKSYKYLYSLLMENP